MAILMPMRVGSTVVGPSGWRRMTFIGAIAIFAFAFATPSYADRAAKDVDYYGNCAERLDKFIDRIEKAS